MILRYDSINRQCHQISTIHDYWCFNPRYWEKKILRPFIHSLFKRNCTCNSGGKFTSVLHPVPKRILNINFFRLTLITFSKQKKSLRTSLDLLSNIKYIECLNIRINTTKILGNFLSTSHIRRRTKHYPLRWVTKML